MSIKSSFDEKKIWFQRFLVFWTVRKVAIAGVGLVSSVLASEFAYNTYEEFQRKRRISNMFTKHPAKPLAVPRPDLMVQLQELMSYPSGYGFVCGPHGTGKSSAVQQAIKDIDTISVNISTTKGKEESKQVALFTSALMKAMDYRPYSIPLHSRLYSWVFKTPLPASEVSVDDLLEVLDLAAAKYCSNHEGQRPAFVIDQINHLPQNLILNLQERAKQWADDKKLRLIFVVSSGDAFRFMSGQGAWSRMHFGVEVGDLSEEESVKYLTGKKIPQEQAVKIHNLTGGRMNLLERAKNFEETANFVEAMCETEWAEFSQIDVAIAEKLAKFLLNGKDAPIGDYKLIPRDSITALLKPQVFCLHLNGRVGFESQPMQDHLRRRLQ